MTDPARHKAILDAFDAVLDHPEAEREGWLESAYADDPELIAAVRALLAADALAPSALPTELPNGMGGTVLVAPRRIKAYRLDDMLGAGGMGEVWRGVRDDGLFEQQVAIKLMRPSRFSSEALAYFDTERRALARLGGAHIARLLDGGVTEEGLPWFMMDLIEGVPLHTYAVEARPDTATSLKLMIAIAGAVHAAHQKLVVHADIKPSNILITPEGVPYLVDFGIASLLAQHDEAARGAVFPSTPAYSSPERQSGLPPSTADDIYGLGLLLRGLLSGVWPDDPSKAPADAAAIAPELAAVIARATAPKAEDRYESAAALAEDMQAFLDHRPTRAYAGGKGHAFGLFVRRHPRAVSAGAAGLVATFAALIVISTLYVRAETRFNDVRTLAGYMLGDFHESLARLPGAATLRVRTTEVGRQYLERLSADAGDRVDIRRDIAIGFARVGHAEAVTSTNATGNVVAGKAALEKSEAILRGLVRQHPQNRDYKLELARTLTWRGGVVAGADNDAMRGEAITREAIGLYDQVLKAEPYNIPAALGRWNALNGLADIFYMKDRLVEIDAQMAPIVAVYGGLAVKPEQRAQKALLLAASENNLGNARYYLSSPEEGVAHYRRALAGIEAARAEGLKDVRLPQRQAYYAYQLSTSFQDMQRKPEALDWASRAKTGIDELSRFDDSSQTRDLSIMLTTQRASVFADMKRFDEAARDGEAAVALRRAAIKANPDDIDQYLHLAGGLKTLTQTYVAAGRKVDACRTAGDSLSQLAFVEARGGVNERLRKAVQEPLQAFVKTCG